MSDYTGTWTSDPVHFALDFMLNDDVTLVAHLELGKD